MHFGNDFVFPAICREGIGIIILCYHLSLNNSNYFVYIYKAVKNSIHLKKCGIRDLLGLNEPVRNTKYISNVFSFRSVY